MGETGGRGAVFDSNVSFDARTILLVERNGRLRSSISAMLAVKRYNVLEASTAEECFLTLEAKRPHIVLIGSNFAGHEAVSLAKTIKNSPRHRFTPVLLITSEDMTGRVEPVQRAADWKQAGITAWIKEPFIPEQLLRIIEMVTF
ncbi:MAG: hypothetical protein HZB82_01390 [Deltaproteobacteria bacterium]|nr:hypothetical protein [Deltaproteobacteria bacterium]